MKPKIKKNKYGFIEISEKPDKKKLHAYYSQKYYSNDTSKLNQYQREYSEMEIEHFEKRLTRKNAILKGAFGSSIKGKRILDVGCGEGWALNYFHQKGNEVKGLEYSADACATINPGMAKYVTSGDVFSNIDKLIETDEKFDVIILDNVLEHVIDPEHMVVSLKELISTDGVLIVEVPNDYSRLQEYLLDKGKIENEFWLAYPDHLSYFNYEGLKSVFEENGWDTIDISCDFPIDMNLLNDHTNYVKDKSKGKAVHFARLEWENLLDDISIELSNELYSTYSKMGLGRNLIGYFRKEN